MTYNETILCLGSFWGPVFMETLMVCTPHSSEAIPEKPVANSYGLASIKTWATWGYSGLSFWELCFTGRP